MLQIYLTKEHFVLIFYANENNIVAQTVQLTLLQVSPSEIEDVILQIPEVVSVSVIGVPHDILGEAPRAYVVTSAKISKEKVKFHRISPAVNNCMNPVSNVSNVSSELSLETMVTNKLFFQVTEHVKAKCAKIKHLVGGVQFLADLPKNATGKVMRKELVKMAQEEKL